jgi:hypothetical protein
MARFHFHTDDGKSVCDRQGAELADLDAARLQAVRLTAAMMQDEPEELWREQCLVMTVTDDAGLTLFTVNVMIVTAPGVKAA